MHECFSCMCACTCMPEEFRGRHRIPGTGLTDGCEHLCECWEWNPESQQLSYLSRPNFDLLNAINTILTVLLLLFICSLFSRFVFWGRYFDLVGFSPFLLIYSPSWLGIHLVVQAGFVPLSLLSWALCIGVHHCAWPWTCILFSCQNICLDKVLHCWIKEGWP